jgi:hypothetical protein
MTKDGFMFLVMGFTGAAAAKIKAYINTFNQMAAMLYNLHGKMKVSYWCSGTAQVWWSYLHRESDPL